MAVIALQNKDTNPCQSQQGELRAIETKGALAGKFWVILNPALHIPCEGNLVRLSFQLL